MLTPWKGSYDQPRQHIKKQRHYFANKGPSSQGYGFSSDHVWMWELDCEKLSIKELMLLSCGIGEDSWEFLGLQGDPISPSLRRSVLSVHWRDWCWSWNSNTFWPPHAKSWLIGKDPDAGKDWGQKEERVSEGEITGWYHRSNEHELGQTPGDGEGQGGLACCSPRGHKESDMTGWLNNNNKKCVNSN